MNVFIAGGTGAIGRFLVPLLVDAGHKVVALTRSADRTSQLETNGRGTGGRRRVRRSAAGSIGRGSRSGGRHPSAHGVRNQGRRSLRGNDPRAYRRDAQPHSRGAGRSGASIHHAKHFVHVFAVRQRTHRRRNSALSRRSSDGSSVWRKPSRRSNVKRSTSMECPAPSFDTDGSSAPAPATTRKTPFRRAIRKGTMPIVGTGAGTYSFIDLRDAAAATVKVLAHEAQRDLQHRRRLARSIERMAAVRCKASGCTRTRPHGRGRGPAAARRHAGLLHE